MDMSPTMQLPEKIVDSLRRLQREGVLCDTELVATCGEEREVFRVHSAVLLASSPSLKLNMSPDNKHVHTCNISHSYSIPPLYNLELDLSVDRTTIQHIIDYIYGSPTPLAESTLPDILKVSNQLQLTSLLSECENFIVQCLNIHNVSHFLAKMPEVGFLEQRSVHVMASNFSDFSKLPDFHEISGELLLKVVSSDELVVESEDELCEAILGWVEHSPCPRCDLLHPLLTRVNLHRLSLACLCDRLCDHPLVKASFPCRDLLDTAMRFHLRPDLRAQMTPGLQPVRPCLRQRMVVFGGESLATGGASQLVEALEKSTGSKDAAAAGWLFYPGSKRALSHLSCCQLGDKVFVAGGSADGAASRQVDRFDVTKLDWDYSSVAPMLTARTKAGCAALGGRIYVVGGLNPSGHALDTCETYTPECNAWQCSPSGLPRPLASCTLLSYRGCLVLVGGRSVDRVESGVYRMDPRESKAWTHIASLRTPRYDSGAAIVSEHVVVCGGCSSGHVALDSTELLDLRVNRCRKAARMRHNRSGHVTCALRNRVVAATGVDETGKVLASAESYNLNLDKWSRVSPLATARVHAGAVVVT